MAATKTIWNLPEQLPRMRNLIFTARHQSACAYLWAAASSVRSRAGFARVNTGDKFREFFGEVGQNIKENLEFGKIWSYIPKILVNFGVIFRKFVYLQRKNNRHDSANNDTRGSE